MLTLTDIVSYIILGLVKPEAELVYISLMNLNIKSAMTYVLMIKKLLNHPVEMWPILLLTL